MIGGWAPVIVADDGVVRRARERSGSSVVGVLQAVLVVIVVLLVFVLLFPKDDSPKSKEGISCGGEARSDGVVVSGVDPIQFIFFRSNGSFCSSMVALRVLGKHGTLTGGIELNCEEK